MKKTTLLFTVSLTGSLFICQTILANSPVPQHTGKISNHSMVVASEMIRSAHTSLGKANKKAAKDFARVYPWAAQADWTTVKDNGFVCRFFLNDVVNRAHYDIHGNWMYTIATYEENRLAPEIRKMVKSSFYGYSISSVNEINSPGHGPVYLIQIQDGRTLQLLRVEGGEVASLEEYEK